MTISFETTSSNSAVTEPPANSDCLERASHLKSLDTSSTQQLIECHTTASLHRSLYRAETPSGQNIFLDSLLPLASRRSAKPSMVIFPGLTEDIRSYEVRAFAHGLAESRRAVTLSLGSNAIGIPGAKDTSTRLSAASDRLEMLLTHCSQTPLVLIGRSMGCMAIVDVLNENLKAKSPIDIQQVVLVAPALVDPSRTTDLMLRRFLPQLVRDTARELIRYAPRELAAHVGRLGILGGRIAHDKANILHQAQLLLQGTNDSTIERVASSYPTHVIVGRRDSVGEINMWENLTATHPRITLSTLENHGHEVLFMPDRAAAKVCKDLWRL